MRLIHAGTTNPPSIVLDPTCDQARLRTESGDRVRLKLTLAERLLAELIVAGTPGIPGRRVRELLWPSESCGALHHRRRLDNLLHRLRAQGARIECRNQRLRVLEAEGIAVLHRDGMELVVPGADWLCSRPEGFTRRQVQEHFDCSRATAFRLCRQWIRLQVVKVAPRQPGSECRYIPCLDSSLLAPFLGERLSE